MKKHVHTHVRQTKKDAMTSRCLDRKEVRHATLRAHRDRNACGGIMHSYKATFSVVWRAGLRRPG